MRARLKGRQGAAQGGGPAERERLLPLHGRDCYEPSRVQRSLNSFMNFNKNVVSMAILNNRLRNILQNKPNMSMVNHEGQVLYKYVR
jgi:hypothetical protein